MSQVCSVFHILAGDPASGIDLQHKFAEGMVSLTDNIPMAGYIKGASVHSSGDKAEGQRMPKTVTRSSVDVAVGGVVVGSSLGPFGAAAGAMIGWIIADRFINTYDIYRHKGRAIPSGFLAAAITKPGTNQDPSGTYDTSRLL
ncbi:unnamed protein product [Allacma fusca]|uniref:Uncharacterized protein n=1 Tax=Allacma fusca TaxID=39272 RepID=A0A8J2LNE4_9HEXA|nr:unnamed protein product [Allacma fusca]